MTLPFGHFKFLSQKRRGTNKQHEVDFLHKKPTKQLELPPKLRKMSGQHLTIVGVYLVPQTVGWVNCDKAFVRWSSVVLSHMAKYVYTHFVFHKYLCYLSFRILSAIFLVNAWPQSVLCFNLIFECKSLFKFWLYVPNLTFGWSVVFCAMTGAQCWFFVLWFTFWCTNYCHIWFAVPSSYKRGWPPRWCDAVKRRFGWTPTKSTRLPTQILVSCFLFHFVVII